MHVALGFLPIKHFELSLLLNRYAQNYAVMNLLSVILEIY